MESKIDEWFWISPFKHWDLDDEIVFFKRYDVKSVHLADIERVRHSSANRYRRINPRVQLHHKLFTFSKFCFLKIVQGCQISKVLASFSAQRSKSRQPVVSIFPLDGVGVVQREDDTTEKTSLVPVSSREACDWFPQTGQTKPNISVVSLSHGGGVVQW